MNPVPFSCVRDGLTIRGAYCLPKTMTDGQRCPAVVLSHCFGGSYDRMTFFAQPFLAMGYAAFWFDFCGGGIFCRSDGRQQDISFATECADLNAVIDYAKSLPFVDADRLSLLGESMGGVVSALVAAQGRHAVLQLFLISPAFCAPDDARLGRFGGASYALDAVPETFLCSNGMTLGRHFHEEAAALDVWQAISGYQGDVYLLHGMADSVVPYAYALKAKEIFGNACRLHLVENMDHCCMNAEEEANALRILRLWLNGHQQVLSIDVKVTGAEQLTRDAVQPDAEHPLDPDDFINAVYFTGYCQCAQFTGAIRRGAVDRQTIRGGRMLRLCADYTLFGLDGSGSPCSIHIVNSGVDGDYVPNVQTDSPLLAWMNDAELTAVLEMRACGPIVNVYGKPPVVQGERS